MRRGASRETDDGDGEHDDEETPEHGSHGPPQLLDSVLEPTAETGQALLRPPAWGVATTRPGDGAGIRHGIARCSCFATRCSTNGTPRSFRLREIPARCVTIHHAAHDFHAGHRTRF